MSDLGWIERLLRHPPSRLSQLEKLVGPLEVDFAGGEGLGHVLRPDPRTPLARAGLRANVTFLAARFAYDMHHEDARRPRDMRLRGVTLDLDVGHATIARMLEQRFGRGRPIAHGDAIHVEHGAWFYLCPRPDASARLQWERERPEWALPVAAPGRREEFLATLVDRLVCETAEPAIVAALSPLAAAASAEVSSPISYSSAGPSGVACYFRPGLPLAAVVSAFRWEEPVASSGDVHMSSWSVAPRAAAQTPPWAPVLGRWRIRANLDRWPRGPNGAELPQLGRAGPSPLYDLRTCQNTVIGISILRADD